MAMIAMAYIFGWLVGAGLPPTATYIIGAVIIVQPLVKLGVNPWVAHFFVFLLSVWGELSPPTSLTAAVSARIAEASFMRTMWDALKICLPITLMTFAIFTRSEMVITPGLMQILNTIAVAAGTCGIAFAMFGRFVRPAWPDAAARIALAILSGLVLFHPNDIVALALSPLVLAAMAFGIMRHRSFGPDRDMAIEDTKIGSGTDKELAALAMEAKREV
jgi:TRAP-type uncharacterized transport system fused permease subunit